MASIAMLNVLADIATIVTAVVAVVGAVYVMGRGIRRKWRLERHLKAIKELDRQVNRNGRRTPLRLSAELAMTVPDILAAAYSSKRIGRSNGFGPGGKWAAVILLEYKD